MSWIPYKMNEQIHIAEMYSFFKYYYDKNYYFPGEMHPFWECVYVLEGSICVTADNRLYKLTQGELIFHKPFEMHKFHIEDDGVSTVVIFSFSAEGELCKKLSDKVFALNENQKKLIIELLNYAESKAENQTVDEIIIDMYLTPLKKDANYSQIVLTYLYRLMLSLNESAVVAHTNNSRDAGVFARAVEYMNERIYVNLSVDEIAYEVGVSTAGLKRIFSRHAGMGVHKFFLKLKLKFSLQMLELGMSVTEVSDKLGFSSQAYFSRVFKREMGISPSTYTGEQKISI